ncbi:hypothetical protein QFC24_005402 [Naganishia onofrii]|uniref:Uncharacterized protein n=1 Tax=Naganishia onofrii TaxID=1851511 RepID=A0ACC2X799_9TREE|nr:hypothetical protein QFC24_005402 [Naganishia onofrii]
MHDLTNRIKELEEHMMSLQLERERVPDHARFPHDKSVRTRRFREGTYASNSTHSNDNSRTKIKASDLPKFYGKDTEDVDEWVEKVSAIFTYSEAKDVELLRILPLLLQGNAAEWFTTLGDEGRSHLVTWSAWKAALRNGFYLPDHEMTKRMLCRNRMLKRTETFGDYFQARRVLQRYVYPQGTSHKILIKDIMEGIPAHLHPIIRANSTEVRTIEDFRRVLIDLEPGIRDVRGYSGHYGKVSIVLHPNPSHGMYCVESNTPMKEICVARSVANTTNSHYALVSNFGRHTVKIPAGTLLSGVTPVINSSKEYAQVNYVTATTNPPKDDFEEDLRALDINPDLTTEQRESLRSVIRRQHQAFAYGNRKLGRTDLAVIKLRPEMQLPSLNHPIMLHQPEGR